jgi:hypothetical protein
MDLGFDNMWKILWLAVEILMSEEGMFSEFAS